MVASVAPSSSLDLGADDSTKCHPDSLAVTLEGDKQNSERGGDITPLLFVEIAD